MNEFQRIIDLREALGGRKFLLAVSAGVVSTLLFSWSVLSESGWLAIQSGTVVAYITGNYMEKRAVLKSAQTTQGA